MITVFAFCFSYVPYAKAATYGSEYVFNSGQSDYVSVAVLDSTHFVVAYRDYGNSYYGTAVVGEISGSTVTYSSEFVFNSASTNDIAITALDSSTFVVSWSPGNAVVGQVSGSGASASISYGSTYSYFGGGTHTIGLDKLDSTHFVAVFDDFQNFNHGRAIIGEVSGNTITYGNLTQFNDRSLATDVVVLDSTTFVAVYEDFNNSNYGTAIIGQTDGDTTITGYGSEYVFNSATTTNISIDAFDSSDFIVSYRDEGNSNYGTVIVGQVSGTAISYGSETVYNSAATVDTDIAALSSSGFVTTYQDGGNSRYGTSHSGTVSGTSISLSGTEDVYSSYNATYHNSVGSLGGGDFVVAYRGASGAGILGDEPQGGGGGSVPEYTTPIAIALALGVGLAVVLVVRNRFRAQKKLNK